MSDNSIRDGKPGLLAIALLWMASRALPLYWVFSQLERKFDFEVPQVKKILEYGFWARKGAMINTDFVTGLSVNPGNYVNHPFPIIWLYTLLYRLGGEVAIYIFLAVVGLVSCLLVYVVLRRYFSQPSAWFAAALFTVAQGAIEFDLNTDVVAFGTVVWLFVMLVVSRAHRAGRALTTGELWLLAAGVFAGGQISWFTLTTVPALMIFSLPPGVKLTEAIRKPLRIAPWRPLLIGGVATALVFLMQIVLYSSGAHGDSDYVKEQLGLTSISRWKSFPVIVVRMLLAGSALWFGAILALFKMRVLLKSNRLFLGAAAYLPTFIGV